MNFQTHTMRKPTILLSTFLDWFNQGQRLDVFQLREIKTSQIETGATVCSVIFDSTISEPEPKSVSIEIPLTPNLDGSTPFAFRLSCLNSKGEIQDTNQIPRIRFDLQNSQWETSPAALLEGKLYDWFKDDLKRLALVLIPTSKER